jgi:hypothetical protein
MRLDRGVDWDELAGIVEDAYADVAPPKLVEAALLAEPRVRAEATSTRPVTTRSGSRPPSTTAPTPSSSTSRTVSRPTGRARRVSSWPGQVAAINEAFGEVTTTPA